MVFSGWILFYIKLVGTDQTTEKQFNFALQFLHCWVEFNLTSIISAEKCYPVSEWHFLFEWLFLLWFKFIFGLHFLKSVWFSQISLIFVLKR